MDVKTGIGVATGIAGLIGILFALDARYMPAKAGELIQQSIAQASQQEAVARESGDLTTQLTLHRNRLSYLAGKSRLTPDEREELGFLREQVKVILNRLSALQK